MKSHILLLSAVFAACQGAAPADSSAAQVVPAPRPTPPLIQDVDASRRTAITEATARVAPTVVTVQTETVERVPVDVFSMFFGGASSQQRITPGIGSGFIIRDNGVIVTNAHVVQNVSNISVMMRDGTTYPAKKLGSDEINDLAVLKIEARNLPVAPLGNSDSLMIGECHRHRQSVRLRPRQLRAKRHRWRHLGDGTQPVRELRRRGRLRRHDPDGCVDQPGEFRWSARERARRSRRREQFDLHAVAGLGGTRVRDPDQPRATCG